MMVRIMIVALLIGSAVLGWLVWEQKAEIQRYEDALLPNGQIEKAVERIQKKAFLYTQYKERSQTEGIKGGEIDQSIAQYVRRIAQSPQVLWGGVSIGKPSHKTVKIGKKQYEDTTYKIESQERGQAFDRGRIANNFFLLEKDSRKMKVTALTIKAIGKTKPHEIPQDKYDVTFSVTVRDRAE